MLSTLLNSKTTMMIGLNTNAKGLKEISVCTVFLCKCEVLISIPKDSSEEKARSGGTSFDTRRGGRDMWIPGIHWPAILVYR